MEIFPPEYKTVDKGHGRIEVILLNLQQWVSVPESLIDYNKTQIL